ncbi:MAG: glycosyltransferase family 4 protein [Lachnospiraceae bacterium]|nr:glycosyltransferase family 4 protein [Lachnospiraceae bacterium]
MAKMKFLLFGTGDYYERYKKWFNSEDVLALLDNSPIKQNSLIDGIKVLSPEEGVKLPFDVIVILSFYVKEMKRQLNDLNIPDDKIYHFYDLHRLIYKKENKKAIQYYGDAERIIKADDSKGKRILLLSQDMTLGGPAIALFYVAKVLVEQGYQILFASMLDGPLREKLLDINVPVVVDVNLQIETMEDADWTSHFSLIFCNTINFHVFLSKRNVNIPVIWWLHDSEFFYHGIKSEILQSINTKNLNVCSVGPVPERAMHNILPELPIERLLYGVNDSAQGIDKIQRNKGKEKKICFVTIGYIENRKGQDILVEAIRLIPSEIRRKAEFYLVGQNSSAFAQKLIEQIKDIPEIVIAGTVDRKGIDEILDYADMMICPSREDPMPTVAAEAMMHGVPCIVSSVTGTAEYIESGINGYIFPSEDVRYLSEKIKWCIINYDKIYNMGINARLVYERIFSVSVFEKKIMELLNSFD